MQNNKPYNVKLDVEKAKALCYSALYPRAPEDILGKIMSGKRKQFSPFLNYINLAKKAAESKQQIGASFTVVNRDIDYKLSCWLNVKIISKLINGKVVSDTEFIEKALEFGMPVEDIIIEKVSADGKDVNTSFSGPSDVFVNKEDGTIFVADTNNGRIVKLDKDWNLLLTFVEPDDPTYEKGKVFYPTKVVADSKGRAYVLAKNVNKGFIKYEYDGSFQGFFGASDVKFNWTDYLWKKFATRAQRDQMESFVPTEYSNAFMDHEGFIYAVTKTFEQWDLRSDVAKPIRRLNALGNDILVKNGEVPPIGDLQWGNAGGVKEPAHFTDITVLENDIYIAVDESRGRIFGYNNQGLLLFAFGNRGNIDGYFRSPSSIEHIGKDLFVLDSQNASITVFTPTSYGELIYKATELYACGEYDASAEVWGEVLKQNGNYDLAYIGLGKSCFRQEKYGEAMEYFKLKRDKRNYSKAFQYYRKEWIEDNIWWVLIIVAVLIVIPFIVKFVKAFKQELRSL